MTTAKTKPVNSYTSHESGVLGSRYSTMQAMHQWCMEHHAALRAMGFDYRQYSASYIVINKRFTLKVDADCTITVDRKRSKLQVVSERQRFTEWTKLLVSFKQILNNHLSTGVKHEQRNETFDGNVVVAGEAPPVVAGVAH